MAINFTVSYTFAPNTTIQSSQVNTNTSDNANVWTGLEAKTKSFSNLKVDATPGSATEVAIKSYVDNYATYRRPVLQFNSTTVVNIETGIDGTAGDCRVLFSDGNLRTDTVTTRIQCNLAQVAALSGAAQSGLRTGTVASNTWYAIYAVKTSDNASNFVAVADTVLPIQANYATLNSNFGTNGWVFLGLIRYGDNNGNASQILKFYMAGNMTMFTLAGLTHFASSGIEMAYNAATALLTYTTVSGTGNQQIPNNVTFAIWLANATGALTGTLRVVDAGNSYILDEQAGGSGLIRKIIHPALEGLRVDGTGTAGIGIYLHGFVDGALGVGSNPIL